LNSNNIVFKKRPASTDEMKASILKIIDFSDERETKGTPSHMPPELILNLFEMPRKWSDVYSAGVIFIELLSLRVPFDGFRSTQVYQFHREGRTLLDENEEWPESIKEILRRCLNREASRRPSFEEILEYLESIRDEFPFDDDNEEEGEEDGSESENVYNEEENNAENNDEDDDDDDDNESSTNASQLDGAPIPSSLII
jgi:serine/threonine protein kinase